jgi:hypothetical protein
MKGATAEPFVSTISPPKRAITTNTGKSQYFLRMRRNPQNSCKKDSMIQFRIGCGTSLVADQEDRVRSSRSQRRRHSADAEGPCRSTA